MVEILPAFWLQSVLLQASRFLMTGIPEAGQMNHFASFHTKNISTKLSDVRLSKCSFKRLGGDAEMPVGS